MVMMKGLAGTEGAKLLELESEAVLQYLAQNDRPEWIVLKQHKDYTDQWVTFFLKRTRPIPKTSITAISTDQDMRKSYQVRLALVRCRFTPPTVGVNLIHTLRWMDLFLTLRQPALQGAVRQNIEQHLVGLMPRLALGEKITMARQAPRGLIRYMRSHPDRRVIRALLQNYHFTYEDAMFLANFPEIGAPILEELAICKRWCHYKEVRLSLLRNPKTPHAMLLPMARSLSEFELQRLQRNPKLNRFARQLIQRILQERFTNVRSKKTHPKKEIR